MSVFTTQQKRQEKTFTRRTVHVFVYQHPRHTIVDRLYGAEEGVDVPTQSLRGVGGFYTKTIRRS